MSKTTHPYFKQRIRELIELGYTTPDIQKMLESQTPDYLFDEIPSLRTIQRYYKQYSSQRGEDWDIRDCDNPEDARIIFEALRLAIRPYAKIPTISKELADMVIRIKKADSLISIQTLIPLASLYLSDEGRDDVHILLTYKPHHPDPYFYFGYIGVLKLLFGDNWISHAIFTLEYFENERDGITVFPVWSFGYHPFTEKIIHDKDKLYEDEDTLKALERYYRKQRHTTPA